MRRECRGLRILRSCLARWAKGGPGCTKRRWVLKVRDGGAGTLAGFEAAARVRWKCRENRTVEETYA